MSPENLSRRIVSMRGGVVPPTPPDPIHAVIAEHRRLWSECCAASNDFEKAEQLKLETPFFKRQLEALAAESRRLDKAEDRSLGALSRIRPTTPAGAAALIGYIIEDMKDGDSPWHQTALANVARALTKMAVQS